MNFLSKLFLPITAPIKFIQEHFKSVLFLTIIFYLISNTDTENLKQPNLQIIELNGPIMIVDEVVTKIEKARTDRNIHGVLFKINSPGGAVAPSIEIAYAIKELKEIKPVVAYANGIMASGGYYASIWASKIIANPGSLVGSIGVIMQSMDASELISKIGIKPQTVKVGEYKEAGTPFREWSESEKGELQRITQSTYDMFVSDVANARGLDKKQHKNFADAHVFTAIEALKVGLIDNVGTITTAKKELMQLSGVTDPVWSKEDKVEKFMSKLINESVTQIISNMNGLLAY